MAPYLLCQPVTLCTVLWWAFVGATAYISWCLELSDRQCATLYDRLVANKQHLCNSCHNVSLMFDCLMTPRVGGSEQLRAALAYAVSSMLERCKEHMLEHDSKVMTRSSLACKLYSALLECVANTRQLYPSITHISIREPFSAEPGRSDPDAATGAGE